MDPKQKNLILGLVGLAVLVLILGMGMRGLREKTKLTLPGAPTGGSPAPTSLTRAPAPENVKVPEPGEKVAEGVAPPTHVAPASDSPLSDAKHRQFSIVAENDRYSPNEIIVRQMDVVTIDFSAKDKTYDLTIPDYGLKRVVEAGGAVKIQFQADQAGKFTFYCELCGGLKSKTTGTLIVVSK
jgi:hypothetical protein